MSTRPYRTRSAGGRQREHGGMTTALVPSFSLVFPRPCRLGGRYQSTTPSAAGGGRFSARSSPYQLVNEERARREEQRKKSSQETLGGRSKHLYEQARRSSEASTSGVHGSGAPPVPWEPAGHLPAPGPPAPSFSSGVEEPQPAEVCRTATQLPPAAHRARTAA